MPYSCFARPPASLEAGVAPNSDSACIMSWNAFGRSLVQVVRGKPPKVTKGNTAPGSCTRPLPGHPGKGPAPGSPTAQQCQAA